MYENIEQISCYIYMNKTKNKTKLLNNSDLF